MTGGVLSMVALAWSGVLASTAAWAVIRTGRRSPGPAAAAPRALLIRPCAGSEPTLLRTLTSAQGLVRSSPLAVRLAVASADDGAAATCETAAATLRAAGFDAETVYTGAVGPNRKADQLARTLARERTPTPVVIVADSDVDLTGVRLDDLLAPLSEPGVGVVWAAPVEVDPVTLADRASAAVLSASIHAFTILSALDRSGMVGKLIAVRGDALTDVGGFGDLVNHLGEDMELARRLRAAGWRTALAPMTARSLARGRSWSTVVDRYARWISVIRLQRPHLLPTYPGVIFATPLVLALCLGAAASGPLSAASAAGLAVASRVAIGWLARARSGVPVHPLSLPLDLLLADALLLAAFVRALGSRRTVWRGVGLHLGKRGGRLKAEMS
jgi:ceramide glucosyltransferase